MEGVSEFGFALTDRDRADMQWYLEEFLEYHRVTGSSPHTVRAYAKALQLWWWYLELDGRDWAEVDVPALAGFVAWLRQGIPPGVALLDPAAAAPPRLAESTLAARLAAVVSFYRYHHDAHGVAAALARAWSGPPRRSRYRARLPDHRPAAPEAARPAGGLVAALAAPHARLGLAAGRGAVACGVTAARARRRADHDGPIRLGHRGRRTAGGRRMALLHRGLAGDRCLAGGLRHPGRRRRHRN